MADKQKENVKNIKDKNTRVYQVTINNPLEKNLSHEKIKEILSKSKTQYFCMADEIAPETRNIPYAPICNVLPTYKAVYIV